MPQQDIPDISLPDEIEEEIVRWLSRELTNAQTARADREDEWEEIQEFYEKTELPEKKNYPFEGAAHLMVPIIPTFCETIKAKVLNTVFAPSDPFTARPLSKDFVQHARPMRSFMTWASREELGLEARADGMLLELLKLGNSVAKVIYDQKDMTSFEFDEATEEMVPVVTRVKDQPEVIHVQLADFFFPVHVRTLEEARWKAHRVRLSPQQVRERIARGIYNDEAEDVLDFELRTGTEYEQSRYEEEGVSPVGSDEIELFEVWFEWDIPGPNGAEPDGIPEKLVGWFHHGTQKFVRLQHNWYPLQMDPFVMGGYENREHRVYANGVGHMALAFQKEISTMHNQRLDNATLANTVAFKRKTDSLGAVNINLRPGVVVPVDEMDDLEPFPIGRQFDSTIQEEQHTLRLLQQRVGVQDFSFDDRGQNAPATTTLTRIAEGTRRFDQTVRVTRRFLGEVMTKALLLYQKYYPEGKPFVVLGEDGQWVEETFSLPPDAIRDGLGISVTATTSTDSKELMRQHKLSLFGVMTQYYGQITQYVLQAQNPEMPDNVRQTLLEIVDGLSTLVRDILEDFELRNVDELVVALEAISRVASQGQPQEGTGRNGQQPGMEDILSLLGGGQAPRGQGAPQGGRQG